MQMINQRLLLEAKRDLVSDRLGFSEPDYFSRFFKRGTVDLEPALRAMQPGDLGCAIRRCTARPESR
jgi:AraC family transcriptional regulator, transcriptional activator of pobA